MSSISLRRQRAAWDQRADRSGAGVSGSRMAARPGCWTVGLGALLANGFRWIGKTRSSAYIACATTASRRGTSTSTWFATMGSGGATPGPRSSCNPKWLLERAPRRGAHRRKRPRRPLPGMMLHQDGSRHAWLAGQPAMDLIVTMDDATSEIYSAFLAPEEGTASTFRALAEVFGVHGLPLSLYTDRGSHYFTTPEAGAGGGSQAAPPRLGGRWRISAWSISRHIRRRPAGGPSGCFRPCRTGW